MPTTHQGVWLGVDLGTTKMCALALDGADGTVRAVVSTPAPAPRRMANGAVIQPPEEMLAGALGLLREVSAQVGPVRGIGVTGQMHGVVLVDAAGQAVSPLYNWQDQQGTDAVVADVRARLGAAAPARTGCLPASGYGAVTLFALRRAGLLPAGTTALTIQDLLVAALTGKRCIDPGDAASWGICDVEHGCWLPEAAALEFPPELLPAILPSGSRAGTLRREAARELDLPDGVPVAVALGDNQASFLGSVPSATDSVLFNLGTGGQMSVATTRYAVPPGLETRPLLPGSWLLVGASLCGGRAYQMLADFYCRVAREVFGLPDLPRPYDAMQRLTAEATVDLPAVSTLFSGTRLHPEARGAITGLTPDNFTPAHLTRAVIEGMVEELLAFYATALQAGASPRVAVGAGNALRRNPLVLDAFQRRIPLPFSLPPHEEEAAVGAARCAAMACGERDY